MSGELLDAKLQKVYSGSTASAIGLGFGPTEHESPATQAEAPTLLAPTRADCNQVREVSAMKRLTVPSVLLVIAFFAGIGPLLSTNNGGGPVPKARQQWEYAHLVLGDAAADTSWQTGTTTLSGSGDVTNPDPTRTIAELYRQLGGKEGRPTFGLLLDLIGHDGWELVTYTHTRAAQIQ
jgi:hypothetical protein